MHFALDQNFPWQATQLNWPASLRITPLSHLAPHLVREYDDWQVLLELARDSDIDGLITNDAKMLYDPRTMVALSRCYLALVVTSGVGDNPVRATGLVMLHLWEISRRCRGGPHLFRLRPVALGHCQLKLAQVIDSIAQHRGRLASEIIAESVDLMRQRGYLRSGAETSREQ